MLAGASSAPSEPAVADDIGDQDRGNFPGLAHGAPLRAMQNSTKTAGTARLFIESLIRSIRSPTPPPLANTTAE